MTNAPKRGRPVSTGRTGPGASALLIRLSAEERAELDAAVPDGQTAWAREVMLKAARRVHAASKR